MNSPEEDESLKNELLADGAKNTADAAAITARARQNAQVVAAFDKALDLVLQAGGSALASQIPGAAFAVPMAQGVAKTLVDDAIARRLGKQ